MRWLSSIWPWGREKVQAEKDAEEQFKAQIREALLHQGDLREAALKMKQSREIQILELKNFRVALESESD